MARTRRRRATMDLAMRTRSSRSSAAMPPWSSGRAVAVATGGGALSATGRAPSDTVWSAEAGRFDRLSILARAHPNASSSLARVASLARGGWR